MYFMNVFSKFFFGECTRFLFILIAFWLFNNDCFAKENNPSKKIKSEIEMIIPKSNNAKTEQNESEKITESSSPKEVNSETKQEPNKEKSSEEAIAEFMKSLSSVQKPFKDYPGYWNQFPDFKDLEITCIGTNDEFPSKSFCLKDLKGNVVIVFFTTTWCKNCEKVFQDLDKLADELSGKNISNVKIITLVLGTEDDDAVKNYYEANKIKSLRKFRFVSPKIFNKIDAVPTCFVFDKKSVPVWGFSGVANYGDPYLLNFIEDLSKEDMK